MKWEGVVKHEITGHRLSNCKRFGKLYGERLHTSIETFKEPFGTDDKLWYQRYQCNKNVSLTFIAASTFGEIKHATTWHCRIGHIVNVNKNCSNCMACCALCSSALFFFFVVFDDKVFGLNTRKCATIILCNFCTRKSPSFSISFTTVQTFMVHAKTQPTQKWYKPNGRKLIGRIARKLNRIKHVLFPLFFIPL